jgi:2C-methyl-D-erythritol 2,4-cyclodiphosphate synthase|nr:MAG TPA: hypothetical protein [Caudoviricetes sp.]
MKKKIEKIKELEHKKFTSKEILIEEIKKIIEKDYTIEELDCLIILKKDKESIGIYYKDFDLPLEVTEVSIIGSTMPLELI